MDRSSREPSGPQRALLAALSHLDADLRETKLCWQDGPKGNKEVQARWEFGQTGPLGGGGK